MRFRGNKFGAKKVRLDGYTFDSKAEAARYSELKLMQEAKKISGLLVHPRYPIKYGDTKICVVELDFEYATPVFSPDSWNWHYEDIKGVDTPISKLKRKLLLAFYGIRVEVLKTGRKRNEYKSSLGIKFKSTIEGKRALRTRQNTD